MPAQSTANFEGRCLLTLFGSCEFSSYGALAGCVVCNSSAMCCVKSGRHAHVSRILMYSFFGFNSHVVDPRVLVDSEA